MFAGWMPWKWIECGWEPALTKRTRRMSPSVARITGPGIVPLYVQAGIEDAGRDLDLPVDRAHRVLAHAARLVRERGRRVQQFVEVVGAADRRSLAADHGRVAHLGVAVHVPLQRPLCRFRVALERELSEHRGRHERCGAAEQASPSKFSHA